MARKREVERAKQRFLDEAEGRDWVQSVGIGLVDRKFGLIISVRPGAKSPASRLLNKLKLDVPVAVRAIKEIRARPRKSQSKDSDSIESLRNIALIRLGKRRR